MKNSSKIRLKRQCLDKLHGAQDILKQLNFGKRQSNEVAGYVLLALTDLTQGKTWEEVSSPLRGITPIIDFIHANYGVKYAPNTRETIRDEAVKHFVEAGVLIRNPDNPKRPTNSGNTVYQIEPSALKLIRCYGTLEWAVRLNEYLASCEHIRRELARSRKLAQVPVTLPSGRKVRLSPGGQNPLIKAIAEEFCPRFIPGGIVAYIGDAENKFRFLDDKYLKRLGVTFDSAAKMPDVVIHDPKRNWLLLIEAVTSAGPVDGKRRRELKELFSGFKTGLVFVTAFANRTDMARFLASISWETEVWVSDDPEHIIHFNGVRFLGPYDDTISK